MEQLPIQAFVTTPDGVDLWTVAEGGGTLTILLTNGGAGSCDYLAPLATLPRGEGRRVIRCEQRGVGRSGGDPKGPFTIADCVADMETIRLHHECGRCIIAGHSRAQTCH